MALSAGAVQQALDAVHTYLVEAGREGKFYREALELLEEAEEVQSWFEPEQTCAGKFGGVECWKELTGQPGCYVWDDYLIVDQTVTWMGECSGWRVQGEGTLKWVWEEGEKTSESTGSLTDGRKQGEWVLRYADGSRAEGTYVDGTKHGQWVLRLESGEVQQGPYVEGKKHGHWVWRGSTGALWEGSLVDGKRHGNWVERDADGGSRTGPYVEGKKHGHWVTRLPKGTRDEDEGINFGEEVVYEGPYVDGKRHGHWVTRWSSSGRTFMEGPYLEGKRRGHWVIHWSNGDVSEGPYVDGKQHGKWVRRSPIAGKKNRVKVSVSIYENGDRVGDGGTWTERIRNKK